MLWQALRLIVLATFASHVLMAQVPAGSTATRDVQYPDLVLHNGKVVTMDDASLSPELGTVAQAMAIREDRIVAVGSNQEILPLAGPQTRKIDLKGRTVLPGFIDTHDHLHDWIYSQEQLMKSVVSDQYIVVRQVTGKTPEEVVENFVPILRRALDSAKPGQWVELDLSRGDHDELRQPLRNLIVNRQKITKELVDQYGTQNPVYVHGSGGLAILLNQLAIDEVKKQFPPGNDGYNPPETLLTHGTGGVGDNRIIIPEVVYSNHVDLQAALYEKEMEWWAGYGITTWHSKVVANNLLPAYIMLDKKDRMGTRFAWSYDLRGQGKGYNKYLLSSLAAMVGQGTPHLWFIGVSVASVQACTTLRIPATVGSRGGGAGEGAEAGRRAFQENCDLRPGSPGYQAVKEAVKAGLPIRNLHTGPLADKDIDYFLRAIAEAAQEAHLSEEQIRAQRHAVDHCYDNPRIDQIPFFRKYGIIASCNTLNIHTTLPLDVKLYGEELAKRVVPRKSMIEGGVLTTSEIDRPIGPTVYTPFFYLYMNIVRKGVDGKVYSPEERIDRISALKTFTAWAAPYVLKEDMLGSLQPGKWADFMILDRDYLTIPEEDIPNIKALATAVGGKFVHVRREIAAELGESPKGAQALLAP